MVGPLTEHIRRWDQAAVDRAPLIPWLELVYEPVTAWMIEAAHLRPGSRVLEVGAGSSAPSMRAAELIGPGGHVVASDISASALALPAAEGSHATISLVRCSMDRLPFEGATFDVAFSRWAIGRCGNPAPSICEVRRVLLPGGILLVADWSHDENAWAMLPNAVLRNLLVETESAPTTIDIAMLLEQCGFVIAERRRITVRFEFDGVDDLLSTLLVLSARFREHCRTSGKPTEDLLTAVDCASRKHIDDEGRRTIVADVVGIKAYSQVS